MDRKNLYRVMVIGPTGSGKSQFCNFVQNDKTNKINKVSNSLNSCTKSPKSNFFIRNNTEYEFIDTAGSSDSLNNDTKNFEMLIDYIKEKKTIDYITLLLKFGEIMTDGTRKYLSQLGKIFTANEFYSHLCVFFTKYPQKPKKKEKELNETSIKEINDILKDIFGIERDKPIHDVKVYFIDTDLDEENHIFDKKSQDTIDIMMEQMKLDVNMFDSINTRNFDFTGKNCELRKEYERKEFEKLSKSFEEEESRRALEDDEKTSLQEEINKLKENDVKRKKKEERLKIIIEKRKEENQKIEAIFKENQEKLRINSEMRIKIEEDARKKGIEISRLDNKIDFYLKGAKILGGSGVISSASSFGIALLET